jgi:hypothetical protein
MYIHYATHELTLSCEAKNKRQKLRCLLLRRKKKNIFYIFMMITWEKEKQKLC